MNTVYQLTPTQAEALKSTEVTPGNLFNPIQDQQDRWIISKEEVEQCNIPWVKTLLPIIYEPKTDSSH